MIGQFAPKDAGRFSTQDHPIAVHAHANRAATLRRLERSHRGLTESLRPKWGEAAVCGSRHRVFVDARSRRKESRDEVVARDSGMCW